MALFGRRPPPSAGVVLPTYRAPAAAETILDRTTIALTATAAGGFITATSPDVPTDQRWLIENAVCSCDSTTPTTLRLFAGSVALQNLLDGSGSGNFDTGYWPTGLLIVGGSRICAQWNNASNGATGRLNLQLQLISRGR